MLAYARADSSYLTDKKIDDDFMGELVPMKDYVPDKFHGPFDGLYYPDSLRILNCWECFEAQGKMCIELE